MFDFTLCSCNKEGYRVTLHHSLVYFCINEVLFLLFVTGLMIHTVSQHTIFNTENFPDYSSYIVHKI